MDYKVSYAKYKKKNVFLTELLRGDKTRRLTQDEFRLQFLDRTAQFVLNKASPTMIINAYNHSKKFYSRALSLEVM